MNNSRTSNRELSTLRSGPKSDVKMSSRKPGVLQYSPTRKTVRRFGDEENGFVLVLFLLFLPVFMGVALLVLDIGRGNNAQSDLQAAADAVAIAGAVELDGSNGALDRSRAAMAELTNSVSMLEVNTNNPTIPLVYEDAAGNPFTVIFLEQIPASDDTPIDQAWVNNWATSSDADANYVYVHAQANDLRTFFPNPVTLFTETVPVAAIAVATNPGPVACNVTPIFICNPFDTTTGPENDDFEARFAQGDLYGRLFELHYNAASSPGPGNFGFLRVDAGPGASVLREAIATQNSNTCYSNEGVDTKPGATVGPVDRAINTHFGIYAGNYSSQNNNPLYRSARNVRMGQSQTGNVCGTYNEEADNLDAMALPRRTDSSGNDDMVAIGGGFWSVTGDWNIDKYWYVNHHWATSGGGSLTPPVAPSSDPDDWEDVAPQDDIRLANTYPAGVMPDDMIPSRYDTYTYEINTPGLLANQAPNSEVGTPQCTTLNLEDYTGPEYKERRTIFAAVLNCTEDAAEIQGAGTGIQPEAFVKMFLTKPSVSLGNDRYLSMEVVDSTGPGGLGSLDEFFRVESILVR